MADTSDTSASNAAQTAGTLPQGNSPLAEELTHTRNYYWFLVTYLVLLSALGSFVNDMYSPALPAMCRFFGCSVPLAQMGLTMGMIGLALGQLVLGPVSDRFGRKPVLIYSVVLFIVAAVVSTFSPNIHVFNICRLFQGLGASGGYFLARTIPADVYSGRGLARLMALVGAINGIAPASAPVIGGVTADAFGWKGVFVVLAAFAGIILVLAWIMKESLSVSARTPGSFLQSFTGYRLLLRNKPFIIHTCLKGIALGLLFAYISASPFILQTHYGLSQTDYGLVIGFNALFMAVGSMLALKFKLLKNAAVAGAFIAAAGVCGQAIALYTVHSIWVFELFMLVILFALGLIFTASNTLAMNEGRHHAGEAAALVGISGYIVGAIVSPLVGTGNILHSTAIVFIVLSAVVVIFAIASRLLPPDLNK